MILSNHRERKEDQMKKQETRKLRADLSPEGRKRAERIGSLTWKSARYTSPSRRRVFKFIPSREQH
jgi:hypothetical protein